MQKITARRVQRGTPPTPIERQSKRINRQQRRLEKDIGVSALQIQAPRQRVIRYEDVCELEPMTDTQRDFFDAYEDDAATGYVLYGSAGTGKSFIALYQALVDVMSPETPYDKIIIVRSSVQSRDLGYLPGDAAIKMEAYESPYHGIFSDLTGKKDAYEKLKDMGKIEFISSSFCRGVTMSNAIVVVEECQNFSFHEISTIATRIGKNAKIIFTGDGAQNDLTHSKHDVSGFREFISVSSRMVEFRNFRFTTDDIVRSGFVKSWIVTCENLGLM
jgi:predicted ribonuclease YlaK